MGHSWGINNVNDLISFIGGVIAISGAVLAFLKRKVWHRFLINHKLRCRLKNELSKEGVKNFFPSAETYMEYKDHGKPAQYLKTATKNKVAYVGFWLSHSMSLGGMMDTLKTLLRNNIEVTFVLMNPYDKKIVDYCERFFGFDASYIESEFKKTIQQLYQFYRRDLLQPQKQKIKIKLHNKPLSAAAYLVDWDTECGKILLDSKIFGAVFAEGYGLEVVRNSKNTEETSLFSRLKKAYSSFLDDNNEGVHTIDINLNTGSFESVIEEVKKKTNAINLNMGSFGPLIKEVKKKTNEDG